METIEIKAGLTFSAGDHTYEVASVEGDKVQVKVDGADEKPFDLEAVQALLNTATKSPASETPAAPEAPGDLKAGTADADKDKKPEEDKAKGKAAPATKEKGADKAKPAAKGKAATPPAAPAPPKEKKGRTFPEYKAFKMRNGQQCEVLEQTEENLTYKVKGTERPQTVTLVAFEDDLIRHRHVTVIE